jgi:hypothetical protein
MENSIKLNLKINRRRVAIIEEDFSTRKLLATTINTFFEDLEACPYESFSEFSKSNLELHQNKTCSVFLSLKSFYSARDNFSTENIDLLKNTTTILMAHSFNQQDLDCLNDFFIEEPIILNKPFNVKDVISLTEWTVFKSNKKKEFSNGFKKHNKSNTIPVL